jgi:hypothetical protein
MALSGYGGELEISPEPTPEEREAILRALAAAGLLGGGVDRSAWWVEGLREALAGEADVTGL